MIVAAVLFVYAVLLCTLVPWLLRGSAGPSGRPGWASWSGR
ncbi:hypothetical protein [Streptomyces mirabilis]